jgi:putative transcriptional regulator
MKLLARYSLVLLLLTSTTSALSQNQLGGRLLVANPSLDDPNFSETVLLIVFHDDEIGTAAVFLNRPTWVDPADTFPRIDALQGYEGELFLGGPVAPTELWFLYEPIGPPIDGTQMVTGGVYVSLDTELLGAINFASEDRPNVRLYAGRAEWGPGQLATEIAAGDWRTVTARPADVFSAEPEALWSQMPLSGDGVTASLY